MTFYNEMRNMAFYMVAAALFQSCSKSSSDSSEVVIDDHWETRMEFYRWTSLAIPASATRINHRFQPYDPPKHIGQTHQIWFTLPDGEIEPFLVTLQDSGTTKEVEPAAELSSGIRWVTVGSGVNKRNLVFDGAHSHDFVFRNDPEGVGTIFFDTKSGLVFYRHAGAR